MTSGPSVSNDRSTRLGSFAPDRLSIFFYVRYLTPILVLVTLAASPDVPLPRGRLVALLIAQAAFGLAAQTLAVRIPRTLSIAVWCSLLVDVAVIAGLAAATGGAGSPLVFLFTLQVIAAGILLSSAVGVRLLLVASGAILALDVAGSAGLIRSPGGFPRGLQALAALWVIAGSAIMFSTSNERELRRRNVELATIRKVTLDIEETLSLEEILADLCRGVVEGFSFSGAAVLFRENGSFVCRGGFGSTGRIGTIVEDRGPVREATEADTPIVVSRDEARRDGTLTDVIGTRGYVLVPLGRDGALVATRTGRRGRPGLVRLREIEALSSLAHHAILALTNARLHEEVRDMAIRDPLTGLLNHGEFQRQLAAEAGRLERFSSLRTSGHRLSLLLIDIDRFKMLNDRYGHPAGDAVLRDVANAINDAVRSFDVVARYGGEEFAVILPETDEEGALQVAERVREAVRSTVSPPKAGPRRRVTVSIGSATAPADGSNPAELIASSDDALYRAKDTGRNRVTAASELRSRTRRVVALKAASRRRPARAARRAADGSERAPARSSRPTRRTPRGR
ncbi:MAG TPA: GGDEF domain-containing protein [Actinomycetota bacterium]|nr:GGDEF domain-containing protein [Actinomycetota bacterium]